MARKLYEKQAVRRRTGALANGVVLKVYTDEAGTVLADVSATLGGSAIAGSLVTTADIAGLGPASLRFYGPSDGTDTLYMRVPSDASLGVQKIEADPDPRLDALEAGSGGGGIAATVFDAKGDLLAATAADTVARLPAGANGQGLVSDSAAATGLKWVTGPVFNVKYPPFNAVGNGTADDAAAIEAAVAAAAAVGGGEVYLPPGTYGLNLWVVPGFATYYAGIQLRTKVTLRGAGRDATTVKLLASQAVGTDTGNGIAIIGNTQLNGGDEQITVEDLTVDGNGANQGSRLHNGVLWIRTRGVHHNRVRVMNVRGTANFPPGETLHYDTQLSLDTFYTDCEALGTAGTQGSGFSANNATNVAYSHCVARGMSAGMGYAHWTSRHLSHVNCWAYANGTNGFNSEYSDDVSYDGCHSGFQNATGSSPWPYTSGEEVGNGSMGMVVNQSTRVFINGCHLNNNFHNGLAVIQAGVLPVPSMRMVGGSLADNDTGATFTGISAQTCHLDPSVLVAGNSVADIVTDPGSVSHWLLGGVVTAPPSVPASGLAVVNPFPFAVTVLVVGGTVSAIRVDEALTGNTAGPVPLGPGGTIRITHSSAPTWTWLRAGAGPPLTPSQLPGLHTDLDAERITAVADTGAVATWPDSSGNAHDATQATAGNRPTLALAGINSRPAVLFDGTNDRLETATFTALTVSTIVVVLKGITVTGDRDVIDGQASARHLLGIRSNNWVAYQGGSGVVGAVATDTNAHILTGLFKGNTVSQIGVDGTLSASADIGSNTIDFLFVGASGSGAGTEFFHGHIARVLVYNRILATAERQAVERHLGAKYGITVA